MKYALVDDDRTFHTVFLNCIKKHHLNGTVHCYSSADEFIENCSLYDAVFLDIDLQEFDGIQISESLRKINPEIIIVFITSHREFVYDAFGLNIIAFIEKSALEERIKSVWSRLEKEIASKDKIVLSLINKRVISLSVDSILLCEVTARKLYVITDDQKRYRLDNNSLHDLYSSFEKYPFIYVSRSCFVNLQKIEYIQKDFIHMEGIEEPIYISRDKYQDIKKAFMAFHAV